MNSDKKGAQHLTAILKEKGVKHVVICPGSRNAPLIISFTSDPYFTCYSLVDERSAGFFALGLSQTEKNTVAIVCTSGSALINIGPAVAEAYYQRLPLLVISADRPNEWLHHGESQTIDQKDIFRNFIRKSVDLIQEAETDEALWFQDREVNQAIDQTKLPYFGPVHINIRFKEPLYGQSAELVQTKSQLQSLEVQHRLSEEQIVRLQKIWNRHQKIMILCGTMFPDKELNSILNALASNGVVVLTESTSNMPGNEFIPCIDKIIIPSSEKEKALLKPDVLITLGGPLISRKIKNFMRSYEDIEHWHVDVLEPNLDAFKHQKYAISMKPIDFLPHFVHEAEKDASFKAGWLQFKSHTENKHKTFLKNAPFSDLKAFDLILDHVPDKAQLQIGNSASIRYVQLIDKKRAIPCFSNRGTSGIEGSISTALGSSINFSNNTVVIAGDLSLMYDSNALWNKYLHPNFKIIVINNNGGGIFRIIEGPKTIKKSNEFIETRHQTDFSKLAELHNLAFYRATTEEELSKALPIFFGEHNKAALIEVITPTEENDKILLNYFETLKTNT